MRRMLDDVFLFMNGSEEDATRLVSDLNNWSSSNGWVIQFLCTGFGTRVSFLDVEVYKSFEGLWHSTVFCKETDVHAYLHLLHITRRTW